MSTIANRVASLQRDLINRFRLHAFNSGALESYRELSKNGEALHPFTISTIKKWKFPIPPKDQQRAWVVSLDSFSKEPHRALRGAA
jgi:restriction endonuclease S subunit